MATININLGIFAVAAGTVDAITATYSPAPASLYNGLVLFFRASGANTSTTPTFKPNTLAAKTVVKKGNQALVAGDIVGDHGVIFNSSLDKWELLNPASDAADTYWQAGAGVNSLMDKRSLANNGQDGFVAGINALNEGIEGQAVGVGAENFGDQGQALGYSSTNEGQSGQAFGSESNNTGDNGLAIGALAQNTAEEGQAIGASAVNTFARSTALGHESISTAEDQTNISKTVRLQDYAGNGIGLPQIDDDGIVSHVTALPSTVTGTKSQVGLGNVDNTSDANKPVSTAQQTALDLKTNKLLTINSQADSYTLVIGDADKLIEMTKATANTLTIPANASVAFPIGTQILLYQKGAGQVTVAITSDTLRSSGSKTKLTGQYASASLIKIASTEWLLSGDITT